MLAGGAVGIVVLVSGAYSTAATTQHFRITHRILDAALGRSIDSHASGITAPALDAPGMFETGAACYRVHCRQCHGAPGEPREAAGMGMLPIPTPLAQTAREWPAEWLYYVTKKGVRMAGMPAWEFRLSEHALWSTVAFLEQLPGLTAADYARVDALASTFECPVDDGERGQAATHDTRDLLRQYACHACHRIDGVVGPDAHVGPPLIAWSRRKYIAGTLPNTQENLVHWLRAPQEVSPQTLMPDLGVTEAHAREMAAWLFALE